MISIRKVREEIPEYVERIRDGLIKIAVAITLLAFAVLLMKG